ncbi:RagB/SusD family nutrient uptake outer membrane protein [Capnocytophaga canimorsus]|nr:RagB/SusD family nutrient uptake outer membrane protein [Capnocytophaga canimorsus]
MKYIKYTYLVFAIALFSACDDFLSKNPDDRAVLDSYDKIGELLTYAYPDQNHQMFCYAMSDNATEKVNGATKNIIMADAYHWREHHLTSQDTPEAYWTACYSAIKQINHALEGIDNFRVNGQIPSELTAYYGEALVARAYAHFMLVSLWSKSYNPQTAASNMGIPYVKEPEKQVLKQYHRGTVQDVYKNIEADLIEGIAYIDDTKYKNKKLHWNKDAANVFAARVYSVLGDFEKVLAYTNKVLSANPAQQIRDLNDKYTKMDVLEMLAQWSKTSENANLLVVPQYSNWFSYTYGRDIFGMSYDAYRYIFRTPFVGGQWIWDLYGQDPNIFIPKWQFHRERSGINASEGYYMIMNPLIQMEEALFLRMEANVMLNNFAAFEQDMNAYLSKRLKNYQFDTHAFSYEKMELEYRESEIYGLNPFYAISKEQRPYLNCLFDLRRKEFYYTGMRWFDLKRFNVRVRHFFARQSKPVFLEPDDNRRELQIPSNAISNGITPNPR